MNVFARSKLSGRPVRRSLRAAHTGRLALACVWLAGGALCHGQVFHDYFTNRETLVTTNGTLFGNNTAATVEVGEPQHGNKPGGHSLWISWLAPVDGVATFDTHGSTFDTLMSAYILSPTNATTFSSLQEQSRNDDDPGFAPTSLIQLGAIAGRTYQIAVDGYNGATGTVQLNWSFLPATSPPPIISSVPPDRAAKQGDTVSLTVNMTTSANLQLNWYFNGAEEAIQTGTNYVITSLQPTNVGRYQLRVSIGSGNNRVRFFTDPIEIQINSDGITNALAQDKLFDALATPLLGDDGSGGSGLVFRSLFNGTRPPAPASLGVASGYNGSQVFNTTFATLDPNEPPHCGVTGGASYWLVYQPPTNGVITLDTVGSAYDTVMEVYTYNGTLVSYADLISLACDNDSLGLHGPARVSFQVNKARRYVVVVDGVNNARGVAQLNYQLNTNLPATPPVLQSQVTTQTVAAGSTVLLAPPISGCPPMRYGWKKDGATLPGNSAGWLMLVNVSVTNSGNYSLATTNDFGNLTVTIPLHVVVPPACTVAPAASAMTLNFPTATGLLYTIEQAATVTGPWLPWSETFSGTGQIFSTNLTCAGTSFFRVRVN